MQVQKYLSQTKFTFKCIQQKEQTNKQSNINPMQFAFTLQNDPIAKQLQSNTLISSAPITSHLQKDSNIR